jgi:hypothetical protein
VHRSANAGKRSDDLRRLLYELLVLMSRQVRERDHEVAEPAGVRDRLGVFVILDAQPIRVIRRQFLHERMLPLPEGVSRTTDRQFGRAASAVL